MRVVTRETERERYALWGFQLSCDECHTDQSRVIRLTSWHNEGFDLCAACIARAGEMIREVGE